MSETNVEIDRLVMCDMEKLTRNEKEWLEDFKIYLSTSSENYIVSWWLANRLQIKTPVINYRLKKLVAKGFLKREKLNRAYGTKYVLIAGNT